MILPTSLHDLNTKIKTTTPIQTYSLFAGTRLYVLPKKCYPRIMLLPERKNILAIDDTLTALTEIRAILQSSYEVHLAQDIESAKTILHTKPIDLMLLDLEMPDMPGIQFLDAIHTNISFYFIPIIVVSAHGTEDLIVSAKLKGASDFVVKPVNPKILTEKVQTVLKLARKKLSREIISRKLNILETACTMNQASRVNEIVGELEQVYCDIAVDLQLAEICGIAGSGDYKTAIKKIASLIKDL
jgi:PleD family two-component response regulator